MKELALFPLGLVLFPGEGLNLHIFEPRYRELVADCLANDETFGIVPFFEGKLYHIGTEVRIISVEQKYIDGRYDIKTLALDRFELKEFFNPWKPHLYAGAVVNPITKEYGFGDPILRHKALLLAVEFGELAEIEVSEKPADDKCFSWQIGHKIGLNATEKSQLLSLSVEDDRLDYIISHLERVIPILKEIRRTQERARLNGHFKFFEPISF